jgi:DNA-binding transcriptional ArsR family regulator
MSHSDGHISSESGLFFRVTDIPTAAEAVLWYLLEQGGDELTEAEVREALDLPRSTTHTALASLVHAGIASTRRVGRTVLYRAEAADPLVRQLKIASAIHTAQQALNATTQDVELAVLFGSASRGEDRATSDIDLFVVARDVDKVGSHLAAFPRIQGTVVTPTRHMQMLAEDTSFSRETSRGITILGA